MLGGKIIVLVVMANVISFVLKVGWPFWRENVVISLAKLINFFGGNSCLFFGGNNYLFLVGIFACCFGGKNVVLSLRKSADLVCVVWQ